MAQYIAYPKDKDTPNRKSRKGSRNTIFVKNKMAKRVAKNALRQDRQG